jgi:hypothetical protein
MCSIYFWKREGIDYGGKMKIISFVSKRIGHLSWIQRARLWFKGVDPIAHERERESAELLDKWMREKGCNKILKDSQPFMIFASEMFGRGDFENNEGEDS